MPSLADSWSLYAVAVAPWARAALIAAAVLVVLAVLFVAFLPTIIQPFLRVVLAFRYRIEVRGLEHLPRTGPVMLVGNHVTWFDGFFLAATLPRPGTALVYAGIFKVPVVGFLAHRCGLIPVEAGAKARRGGIEAGRKVLADGGLLGIFPEGQLSRIGLVGPFKRGMELILAKTPSTVVVPVYLGNLWGSLLSYSGGRFVWKKPQGWRRTVVLVFGPPIPPPVTAFAARQAVLEAGVRAAEVVRPRPPETIDPARPRLDDPALGPITASANDLNQPAEGFFQPGTKEGSVGLPLPGVAVRAVGEDGMPLPPDGVGRLEALVPGRPGWADLNLRGHLDGDGFVYAGGPASSAG